jgi:hypothetical protein
MAFTADHEVIVDRDAPAALVISLVISMSSREGLGSPEGWLCTIRPIDV